MAIRKTKRKRTTKPRAKVAVAAEAKSADELERKHWPEIEKKLAASRESIAKGKTRKWDLDRFLTELERRRRAKQAAE
jgi:hypothetical protein